MNFDSIDGIFDAPEYAAPAALSAGPSNADPTAKRFCGISSPAVAIAAAGATWMAALGFLTTVSREFNHPGPAPA
jgi:hypothetical protein